MAMKPIEMIDFLEESFTAVEKLLSIGRDENDFSKLCRGHNLRFQDKVMQGLISWRLNMNEAKKYLFQSIDVINNAIAELRNYESEYRIVEELYLETAIIISYLIDEKVDFLNYKDSKISKDRLADFEVAKRLTNRKYTLSSDFLVELKFPKREKLAFETYGAYFKLLLENNRDKLEEMVKNSEVLYLKRKRNSFYSGGLGISGGGPDNDVVVDFILGAVLKYISYDEDSIHKWRW